MPLTSYFVDFVAHIDERKRPENFPKQVHDKHIFDVESIPHLQHKVNERFIKIVSSSGLVVLKDEGKPSIEGQVSFSNHMFVFWHLVTHITLDVKLITDSSMQDTIVPGSIVLNPTKDIVN